MSAGRKNAKTPTIAAPPQVTRYEFNSPLGDRYLTRREGITEISDSILGPQTSRTIQTGQQALKNLADELSSPDARRLNDIGLRARDFYELQAGAINSEADALFSAAQSDLSKRFGGAFNATFGTDYLARLQNNRLSRLYDASKEASLLGEDLYRQDEDSRMKRFTLFQNYLLDEHNKAQGVAGTASDLLQNETNRAQDLAVKRASMVQRTMEMNAANDADERRWRVGLISQAIPLVLKPLNAF